MGPSASMTSCPLPPVPVAAREYAPTVGGGCFRLGAPRSGPWTPMSRSSWLSRSAASVAPRSAAQAVAAPIPAPTTAPTAAPAGPPNSAPIPAPPSAPSVPPPTSQRRLRASRRSVLLVRSRSSMVAPFAKVHAFGTPERGYPGLHRIVAAQTMSPCYVPSCIDASRGASEKIAVLPIWTKPVSGRSADAFLAHRGRVAQGHDIYLKLQQISARWLAIPRPTAAPTNAPNAPAVHPPRKAPLTVPKMPLKSSWRRVSRASPFRASMRTQRQPAVRHA